MLSIIIPLYNKENAIANSINSILSQAYGDFEIIIIDDGSTDNSGKIIREFSDKRIKIYSQSNRGVANARNRGVLESIGDYCYFIDADDYMVEGALKQIIDKTTEGYDLIIGGCEYINKSNEVVEDVYKRKEGPINNVFKSHFSLKTFMHTGTLVIKREIALMNPFNENYRRYEDIEAYLKWAQCSKAAYCIDYPLFRYNKIYSSLSIPNLSTYKYDYSTNLSFENDDFYLNCSKGRMLMDAFYSYPSMRWEIINNVGFKGCLFGIIARCWSIKDELLRRIKNLMCNNK